MCHGAWGHRAGHDLVTEQRVWASWWLGSKEPTSSAGDAGLSPDLGRSPGGENGNPLQCSCLRNPMDKGTWVGWGATVHGVAKSRT